MPGTIPPQVLDILARFALGQGGALTGSTRPILENRLVQAMIHGGDAAANMDAIASWIWNELDMDAWGSPEKVRAWANRAELAKHTHAKRVLRVDKDPDQRLGRDTVCLNRYALTYEREDGVQHEVPIFEKCLAILESEELANVMLAELEAAERLLDR